jgi:hypothetical protein
MLIAAVIGLGCSDGKTLGKGGRLKSTNKPRHATAVAVVLLAARRGNESLNSTAAFSSYEIVSSGPSQYISGLASRYLPICKGDLPCQVQNSWQVTASLHRSVGMFLIAIVETYFKMKH